MGSRQPLLTAYVFSAIALVTAVLGSLVFIETATIKMSVPVSKLAVDATISGGASGHDLTTTRIEANVTDTMQGTASTAVLPPGYASGQVVFSCSPCPTTTTTIPDSISVSTTKGVHYVVLQKSQIVPPKTTSPPVEIRALVQGTAGNTAANTVTVIDKPIPNVTVTNPQPITTGSDGGTSQVVTQPDLDRVRTELTAKVAQDLDAALKAQAEGLTYINDGTPQLKVDADHKVGDRVPTFTMTIYATLSAIAFSQGQADALLRAALNQRIQKGFQLTTDPIVTSYTIVHASANGDVTIKGSAIGVVVPNVTADELKARIKGLPVVAARHQLELVAPGTIVDISVKPAVPWLPVLQDHIKLTIVMESGGYMNPA